MSIRDEILAIRQTLMGIFADVPNNDKQRADIVDGILLAGIERRKERKQEERRQRQIDRKARYQAGQISLAEFESQTEADPEPEADNGNAKSR